MSILTITSKGQVTFKREVLQHLGLKPGDQIEIDLLPGGRGLVRPVSVGLSMSNWIGCLQARSPIVASLEDIDRAISDAWSGRV